MNIERDARTQLDIAQIRIQIKKALDIKHLICKRYSGCDICPLSKLEVLDTRTCEEIEKLAERLELSYKVVETL